MRHDPLIWTVVISAVVIVVGFLFCALTAPGCSCPCPSKPLCRIELKWCWYDVWIGAYIDRPNRIVYVCPLPTIVIKITVNPGA